MSLRTQSSLLTLRNGENKCFSHSTAFMLQAVNISAVSLLNAMLGWKALPFFALCKKIVKKKSWRWK